MTALPDLGILAIPGAPPGFVSLVQALAAWCLPRAADPTVDSPDAWLASSPACPGLGTVSAGTKPLVVWVDHREAMEQAAALDPAPRIVVTARPGLGVLGARSVLFPEDGLDLRHHLPVPPVVRRRWRSRLGLPATMVVLACADSPTPLPDDLLPTAMALASVVVATGPRLGEALAWAAPCVTDARSAAALGAVEGEVVFGPSAELSELAELADDVADDDGWMAALSSKGRRLVERRVDQCWPARRVAEDLGLVGWGQHLASRTAQRVLDDLGTPGTSPLRSRIETLVVPSAP